MDARVLWLDGDDVVVGGSGDHRGLGFVELLAPWSRDKGRLLCEVIRNEGGAYDWEIDVAARDDTKTMRAVGGRHGDRLIVGLAHDATAALCALETATRHDGEGAGDGAVRGALRALGRRDDRRPADTENVFRDLWRVTGELAAAHRELVRKNNELEILRSDRDRVLGMVVHDIRTPLHVVRMAASILEQVSSDPARASILGERIERASVMMLRLIDDLIDLSAIESGVLRLELGRCDVAESIAGIAGVVELVAAERSVGIRHDVQPNLEVLADGNRIEQVLLNLMENAVRHTDPDTEILLEASDGGSLIEIRVSDRGPGVPAELEEAIFEPWVQGGSSHGRAGLGLAISRRIVEAHGGRLWCENRPGGGAVFAFSLPVEPRGDAGSPAGRRA